MTSTNDGRARARGVWSWVVGSVVSLMAVVSISCGGSSSGASKAPLLSGGSTFESGDGDLAPNTSTPTPAIHDWNFPVEPIDCGTTIPGGVTNCGLDLVKSQTDDALGQGAKEDDPNPTIVDGSIPPSKDDLSRFYVNQEKVGGKDYLYLAWERSNLLGSAHMDFEFNQSALLSGNGVTPQRTAGDLLIDFDFSGSGVPVLQKHTWIIDDGTNTPAQCEASNTLPCWDKAVALGSFAEAAVNSAPVVDTNPPNAPRTLDGNTKNGINSTFGEAGIDLTGSGIFSPTVCTHFGAAWLKSRSSGNSFTSELKDFIAPIPVNISNCGTIVIIKHTDPRGQDQSFSYSTTGFSTNPGFTLNDNGLSTDVEGSNKKTYTNVFAGSYSVTEGADPTGYAFESLNCTSSGGASVTTATKTANITMVADGNVTCTYVNKLQQGAIKVTKTYKNKATATDPPTTQYQSGVSFTVNGVTKQTDSNGVACFDGLNFAEYTVHETVPTGYVVDANDKKVTVDNNAKCSDSTYVGETVSFSNTPLTNLTVSVDSQVAGGTGSAVTCVDSGDVKIIDYLTTLATGDGTGTANNLVPGTYTCTVVIDP